MGGIAILDTDEKERANARLPERFALSKTRAALLSCAALTTLAALVPLLLWQNREQRDAVSLNNLRRLGQGLLLYSQDWDDRPMPPVLATAQGVTTWPQILLPYLPDKATLNNPLNPLARHTTDPTGSYAVPSSYALNSRFCNTFGLGTYPLDALELPYRTALFVEAGPMRSDPVHAPPPADSDSAVARLDYGDIGDTSGGKFAYPSSRNGKIALVAADGHAETVVVAHYFPTDGPHDKRYGRIGGAIYNWNGGFATGETDKPPRE